MSKEIKIEGQLNFLELMGSFIDSSGASVSITKPRSDIKGRRGAGSEMAIKDGKPMQAEPEQLSFDLGAYTVDGSKSSSHNTEVVVKELEKIDVSSGNKKVETYTEISEAEPFAKNVKVEATAIEDIKVEVEPVTEAVKPAIEAEVEPVTEAVKPAIEAEVEPVTEEKTEPVKKEPSKNLLKVKNKAAGKVELFDKCSNCWCCDCKHNSRNEGKPRQMCGTMMACPACDTCEEQGYAEICEIGSAKEGCKTRAIEEGLFTEDEEV